MTFHPFNKHHVASGQTITAHRLTDGITFLNGDLKLSTKNTMEGLDGSLRLTGKGFLNLDVSRHHPPDQAYTLSSELGPGVTVLFVPLRSWNLNLVTYLFSCFQKLPVHLEKSGILSLLMPRCHVVIHAASHKGEDIILPNRKGALHSRKLQDILQPVPFLR